MSIVTETKTLPTYSVYSVSRLACLHPVTRCKRDRLEGSWFQLRCSFYFPFVCEATFIAASMRFPRMREKAARSKAKGLRRNGCPKGGPLFGFDGDARACRTR